MMTKIQILQTIRAIINDGTIGVDDTMEIVRNLVATFNDQYRLAHEACRITDGPIRAVQKLRELVPGMTLKDARDAIWRIRDHYFSPS